MTGTAEGRSRCLPEVREDDSRLEREPRNQGCCPQTPDGDTTCQVGAMALQRKGRTMMEKQYLYDSTVVGQE